MAIKIDKINNIKLPEDIQSSPVNIVNIIIIANFLISRAYFDAAEKLLLGNLKTYPNEAKLWAALGALYAETNQEQKAANAFNHALDLDPFNPDALYYLGFFNNNPDMIQKAAEKYAGLLEIAKDPLEKARLANQLGQCYVILGEMPEALDSFIAAYRANPEFDALMNNLGSYFLAVSAIVAELDLANVQDEIIGLLNKLSRFSARVLNMSPLAIDHQTKAADVSRQLKNTSQQLFEKAIKINPRNSLSYLNLGLLSLGEKNYEKAENHLRKAIEINPRNSLSHYNLGLALLFRSKIGEFRQAEIEFEETRRLGHKNGSDFFYIGRMFLNTRAYAQAEKWFEVAFDVYCKAGNEELFYAQYGAMLEQISDEEKHNKAREILGKCRSKP